MFLSTRNTHTSKTLVTDILSMIGNILSGRPAFSQAHDFSQGKDSNANSQWPNLQGIGPLAQSRYVDAYYPDVNSVPYYSGQSIGRETALNNTLPFKAYPTATADAAQDSPQVDFAGNSNGGDDNGYYFNNNPFAPQQAPLASFTRISI